MPTYDFRCSCCDLVFEVFRPMEEAGNPALCPQDGSPAVRSYAVAEAYMRDRAPVVKAEVRLGDYQQRPGSIVDHIVTGDGMARHRQTEKDLLQAAREAGVRPNDSTIVLRGKPGPKPPRKLVSYPGKPARTMTRQDRK